VFVLGQVSCWVCVSNAPMPTISREYEQGKQGTDEQRQVKLITYWW